MSQVQKIGRPKAEGARYPSGKLKPYRAQSSPVMVRRMIDAARTGAGDPTLATPVGWLRLHGTIGDIQLAAAMEYGRVRARYDRALDAPARTSASPSYGAAYGSWDVEVSTVDAAERARMAIIEFHAIENALAPIVIVIGPATRSLRASRPVMQRRSEILAILDRVCVENVHPSSWEIAPLCGALDRLASVFKLTSDFRKR